MSVRSGYYELCINTQGVLGSDFAAEVFHVDDDGEGVRIGGIRAVEGYVPSRESLIESACDIARIHRDGGEVIRLDLA